MNGSITQAAFFFNNSPKRQTLLEKVISEQMPEGKKKKMKDLCRTRWVYRHEAYETFLQLLPAIMETLELISLHSVAFGDDWKWDAESTTMATGLLHTFRRSVPGSLLCGHEGDACDQKHHDQAPGMSVGCFSGPTQWWLG